MRISVNELINFFFKKGKFLNVLNIVEGEAICHRSHSFALLSILFYKLIMLILNSNFFTGLYMTTYEIVYAR